MADMRDLVTRSELRHIAFIMDGNGRWASKRLLPREAGHRAGADNFKKIVRSCGDIGIDTVTVYAFSTENWKRPAGEVNAIMRLLDAFILEAKDEKDIHGIRYVFLGDKDGLPDELASKCRELEELTKQKRLLLNIALNYGGRAEIVRAVNQLIQSGKETVCDEDVASALYTAHTSDPDLIVRTAGEYRLSNFLLWQAAYSELYFTDTLWPDFDFDALCDAVREFSRRKRRYGGI